MQLRFDTFDNMDKKCHTEILCYWVEHNFFEILYPDVTHLSCCVEPDSVKLMVDPYSSFGKDVIEILFAQQTEQAVRNR